MLLVEDDPDDVALMRAHVVEETHRPMSFEVCSSLAEAIASVEEIAPDLILLDLGLPDSNGIPTFEQMYGAAGNTPVIVLSGLDDCETARECIGLGAHDYLVKGQAIGHIAGAVYNTVARAQSAGRQALHKRILAILNRPYEWRFLLRDLLGEIKDFTGVDAAAIRLVDGKDFPYFEYRGFSKEFLKAEWSLCSADGTEACPRESGDDIRLACMCGNVIQGRTDPSLPFFTEGGSFWTNSTTKLLAGLGGAAVPAGTRNRCHDAGYETVALIPLQAGTERIGLLQLNDHRPDRLTLDMVRFFESVGNSIGIAFTRRRAEESLVRAEKLARGLGELKERLLLNDDLEQQLKDITDAVVGIFDTDFARVWVIEPGDNCDRGCIHSGDTAEPHVCRYRSRCLHLIASSGRYTHTDGETHGRVPFGCYKIGRVAAGDEAKFVTNDAANDPLVHDHEWVKELGLVSFAGYRLLSAEGEPLGVLALFSKHTIGAQDDACLDDVAATTSLVIQTARARAAQAELQGRLRQAQKLESIGTLASGVAHEINNPIMGIMNYAQLIQDRSSSDGSTGEFAGEIINETKRVATIVKSLLAFARNESQQFSQAKMKDILDRSLSLVRTILRHDQIDLEVNIARGLPELECRELQMQQVVINLITNARDALNDKYPGYDDRKRISLTATTSERRGSRWIRLTVTDTGPGIPDDVRDRVFDPFYTTKRHGKGTGLGLSITHGIVTDHGGEISVESKVGEWTRFHVDLPALPTDEPAPSRRRGEHCPARYQDADQRVHVGTANPHRGRQPVAGTDGHDQGHGTGGTFGSADSQPIRGPDQDGTGAVSAQPDIRRPARSPGADTRGLARIGQDEGVDL